VTIPRKSLGMFNPYLRGGFKNAAAFRLRSVVK
jgi:hypothetical protein